MKTLALLGIVGAIAGFGCGGGASEPTHAYASQESSGEEAVSDTPVRKRGGDMIEVTMGPAGGTLELGNGARIEIPQGALDEATPMVFRVAPATTAFLNQEGLQALGPLVLVSPEIYGAEREMIVFSIPLSSLPAGYDAAHLRIANEQPEGDQREYAENTTTTRWHYNAATMEGGRAIARFPSLPGMRLQFVVSK